MAANNIAPLRSRAGTLIIKVSARAGMAADARSASVKRPRFSPPKNPQAAGPTRSEIPESSFEADRCFILDKPKHKKRRPALAAAGRRIPVGSAATMCLPPPPRVGEKTFLTQAVSAASQMNWEQHRRRKLVDRHSDERASRLTDRPLNIKATFNDAGLKHYQMSPPPAGAFTGMLGETGAGAEGRLLASRRSATSMPDH